MFRRRTVTIIIGLSVVSMALPARAAGPDWTQWQGDSAHTGWNSAEATISPATADSLHQLWQAPAQHVVVQAGVVYVGRLQHRAALDAATGTPLWVKRGRTAGIAVSGDRVVVSGATNRRNFVKAFDAADGLLVWQHSCLQDKGGPVIDAGVVYVGCTGFVKAWELEAGTRMWVTPGSFTNYAAPAVDGARVFVTTPSAGVVALDASDGSTLWQRPAAVKARRGPSADGTNLLYPNLDRRAFVARAEDTGAKDWSLRGAFTGQAVDADSVYAGMRGVIKSVDAGTGAVQWTRRVTKLTTLKALSAPIVANGLVYVGVATASGPKVAILNASTGHRVNRLAVPAAITGAPRELVVAGGQLYVTAGAVVTAWGI
jgi:outer membrane protein assembly factor BamB